MAKIFFSITEKEWHGFTGEWIAVEYINAGAYLLKNNPFHIFNVSNGDTVKGKQVDGDLVFDSVQKRGGHSTYRVRLKPGREHFDFISIWPQLEDFGCSYEHARDLKLYSIDVPPDVNVHHVYSLLQTGVVMDLFDLEEAHFGHLAKP